MSSGIAFFFSLVPLLSTSAAYTVLSQTIGWEKKSKNMSQILSKSDFHNTGRCQTGCLSHPTSHLHLLRHIALTSSPDPISMSRLEKKVVCNPLCHSQFLQDWVMAGSRTVFTSLETVGAWYSSHFHEEPTDLVLLYWWGICQLNNYIKICILVKPHVFHSGCSWRYCLEKFTRAHQMHIIALRTVHVNIPIFLKSLLATPPLKFLSKIINWFQSLAMKERTPSVHFSSLASNKISDSL